MGSYSNYPYIYTSSNTTNANTTWLPTIVTSTLVPNNTWIMTNSTSSTYSVSPEVDIKRCRNCNHAHLAEQTDCIDAIGNMVYLTTCDCKEYLPKDNLEYLEYLDKKKADK